MPPNSHGTNGITINQMIGNDPSFFILNSDEFRKTKAAEVKGRLNLPTNDTNDYGNRSGIRNTSPIKKYERVEAYPTGSHHRNTLGLNGINRSHSTLTNNSSGKRAYKETKSVGTRPEKEPIERKSAETTRRRPTATPKPRVGLKNPAAESCQPIKNGRNLPTLEKSGVGTNSNLVVCTNFPGKNSKKAKTDAGSEFEEAHRGSKLVDSGEPVSTRTKDEQSWKTKTIAHWRPNGQLRKKLQTGDQWVD